MTDFINNQTNYNITLETLPGIYFVFLYIAKSNKLHQRVLFFEAKENAWLNLQNIFNNL